jgi:DNA-binding transcriptional LysR family regulator
MTIDTIALQCFIAVAETQSFTKAAQRVQRTQSAVSQQIAKLEYVLDKKFFNRSGGLTLTNDGEIFLSYAKQIFKMHCEALDHFKEPDLGGEVRFGIPEDFASVFLYDVLSEFVQIHPRISLHIECDLTLNLYDNFVKKDLDLVVVKTSRRNEFKNATELSLEKLVWVGDKKLVNKNQIIPLIVSPKPCVHREAAINELEKKGIKWRIAFSSHSYAGKVAALKAGIGIAVLPQKMIPNSLSQIRSEILPKLKDTHICLLKHHNKNAAVNSFEDFVVKHLS